MNKTGFFRLATLAAIFMLAGCMSGNATGEPPMLKHAGMAQTAVFVPVKTNDADIATAFIQELSGCLDKRNFYRFVPAEKVANYVNKKGYDTRKVFGLGSRGYSAIAKHFNVDVTFSGSVAVKSELTISGWRRDVNAVVRLNRGTDGKELGQWRATTNGLFASAQTAADGKQMAKRAVNQICSKIILAR